jgi:2,4'-dihydroxyacetophenone dioxygenase
LPITAFNSFGDGLAPNQRSREHFIANIDLEDGPHWVPYADGVWIQLCHFNVTSGGFSVVLKGLRAPRWALTTTSGPFGVSPYVVSGGI